MHAIVCYSVLCANLCWPVIFFCFHLDVTVHYEDDLYSVCEEAGVVSLALVLEGDATIPVTVSVNTLNLTNSSVGDAATGELENLYLHIP